jgi:NDP-mannose synthase
MKAVIQCGGKGVRLRPYTSILPKPLMPIGSRPVLELLIRWLRRSGVREVYITTGYLGDLIRSFCGDGRRWNVKITYTTELEPLGTIGPLSLLRKKLDDTFFVLNGDVLTDLSLMELMGFHRGHGGALSIGATVRSTGLDFGVIEEEGGRVRAFREKPVLANVVSMGVYCMSPDILEFVPSGVPYGFDDLVLHMLAEKVPVHVFKHEGLWLDVGRVDDFHRAQNFEWEDQPPSLAAVGTAA